jgi:DNA-binding LytR/AlgR family response regulator
MSDILCLGAYDELYRIDTSQLLYFEADDHYTNVYYANGTHFVIPFGLSKVEDLVMRMPSASKQLMRLGRKYIVNTHRIFRVSTIKELIFLNDDRGKNVQLHISKPVLRGLIDTLKDVREKK